MARKLSIDEFRASASKEGAAVEGIVLRFVPIADPEVAQDDSRTVRFIFSDGTVDRSGDSINPDGWQVDSFMKNPVALWAHDSTSMPIGRASNISVSGGKLRGDIEFMPREINELADNVYQAVKGGWLKAVSVGFVPLNWSYSKEKDRPFGIDFNKQELLEVSVCPVPCNPNALQEAKAAGCDMTWINEWASKVLEENGHVVVERNFLEETFRKAKTPRSDRQKYLAKSQSEEWVVGASRDLPLDDASTWDGAAAAKRMLDAAGFDGDSPDAAKAAKGFLLRDKANPDLRGSYKLPFADIVGGSLKAVKAGISAAAGRLNQTDAPSSVLDEAKSVIDGYEQKFGEDKAVAEVPIVKSGRRISAANEAELRKAMDHHESASQCIKNVLASNAADEDGDEPDGGQDGDSQMIVVEPPMSMSMEMDQRAKRLAEARAIRASLKH